MDKVDRMHFIVGFACSWCHDLQFDPSTLVSMVPSVGHEASEHPRAIPKPS